MINIKQLQQQLELTEAIIANLKQYRDRVVSQLPKELIERLYHLQYAPKLTTSGIESVSSILNHLYATRYYLNYAIDNPEEFIKLYSSKPASESSPPQNTSPNKTPQAPKQLDLAKKTKIIIKPASPAANAIPPANPPKITIKLDNNTPSPASSTTSAVSTISTSSTPPASPTALPGKSNINL